MADYIRLILPWQGGRFAFSVLFAYDGANKMLLLPFLAFFAAETTFALAYSHKAPIFYGLSFLIWLLLGLGSAAAVRTAGRTAGGRAAARPEGRRLTTWAIAAVLPAVLFNATLLIKILPGRISAPSNVAALVLLGGAFGAVVSLLARRNLGPSAGFRFAATASVFALANAAGSFLVLPELPVDRPGPQVLALGLVHIFLPAALILAVLPGRGRRTARVPWAAVAALSVLAAGVLLVQGGKGPGLRAAPAASATPATAKKRPNIVLIVIDTGRIKEMSVYGSARPTTPRLAELASDSVVFDRAYANADWTIPSHACLLTGFFSSVTRTNFQSVETGELAPLDPQFKSLAEILAAEGYRTASFPSNSYNLNRRFGCDRGFERLWNGSPPDANLMAALLIHRLVRKQDWSDWLSAHLPLDEFIAAADLNPKIFRWLNRQGSDPFFLFINYTEPHGIYALPKEFREFSGLKESPGIPKRDPESGRVILGEREKSALLAWHNAELRAVDEEIGRIMGRLKSRGLYDDTLVVVTSDHGELLGEHDDFGHVHWLYEEIIHVPLIVKYPGGEFGGTRSEVPVQHIDIFSEILDRLAIPAPPHVQGQPFAAITHPVVAESRPSPALGLRWPERYNISQYAILSRRRPGFKLIRSSDGREELFDLAVDPGEKKDLADPETRRLVGQELGEYLDELTKIARLYEKELRRVKYDSLGYVR
jgi:arylsulfatase A-like enzyme